VLEIFLHANSIGIAAISETKLSPKHKFSILGYKTYRSDRTQFGGGVMLFVANELRHEALILCLIRSLEATAIALQLQNNSQQTCVAAYLPPTATITSTDLDAILSTHDTVIIAGDLNCKHPAWNNVSTNKNGNTLLSYCGNKSIDINYPDQPTH
jgi:hypothetical protein